MTPPPTLDDIEAAARAIDGQVRETPLLRVGPQHRALAASLVLKLECLQVAGSFKARGAVNTVRSLGQDELARGLVTASGGNHGLGVAYAGWQSRVPVTIYLPESTPAHKAAKLEDWGAKVVIEGAVWDDANRAALAAADRDGQTYVHPFADPRVIAGQGTVGLEILSAAPDTDTLLVAIGGGGLISGVATAAKALKPGCKVIGIEPVGAPTLHDSLRAGEVVELAGIETAAGSLAPRRSDPLNFEIIRRHVDDIVLVNDEDMRAAARWLWFECGIAAELSAAAAIAALQTGAYTPALGERVAAIVCGAGYDGMGSAAGH